MKKIVCVLAVLLLMTAVVPVSVNAASAGMTVNAVVSAQTDVAVEKIDTAVVKSVDVVAYAADDTAKSEKSDKEDKGSYPLVGNLVKSLIIGFIIALIVTLVKKGGHNTIQKKETASSYIVPGSLKFSKKFDRKLYEKTEKKKIEKPANAAGSK